eukprot:IDg4664t1
MAHLSPESFSDEA